MMSTIPLHSEPVVNLGDLASALNPGERATASVGNSAMAKYLAIALNAASHMQWQILSKYPDFVVNIYPIAIDAVETREERVRVLGGDFPVIGMVYAVCMGVMEEACQKYLPPENGWQDDLWTEFWPCISPICDLVVPESHQMRPRSRTPPSKEDEGRASTLPYDDSD